MGIITYFLVFFAIVAAGVLYVALLPAVYSMKTNSLIYDSSTQAHFGAQWEIAYDLFKIGVPLSVIFGSIIYIFTRKIRDGAFP